jgi:ketopantoate reductase
MSSDSFFPRIAVVGSGAIGSYYGAKLAASGQDVHFLMRADLEAVKREGLNNKILFKLRFGRLN